MSAKETASALTNVTGQEGMQGAWWMVGLRNSSCCTADGTHGPCRPTVATIQKTFRSNGVSDRAGT